MRAAVRAFEKSMSLPPHDATKGETIANVVQGPVGVKKDQKGIVSEIAIKVFTEKGKEEKQ